MLCSLNSRYTNLDSICCLVCDFCYGPTPSWLRALFGCLRSWFMFSTWQGVSNYPKKSHWYNLMGRLRDLLIIQKTCFDIMNQTTIWVIWKFKSKVCWNWKKKKKKKIRWWYYTLYNKYKRRGLEEQYLCHTNMSLRRRFYLQCSFTVTHILSSPQNTTQTQNTHTSLSSPKKIIDSWPKNIIEPPRFTDPQHTGCIIHPTQDSTHGFVWLDLRCRINKP